MVLCGCDVGMWYVCSREGAIPSVTFASVVNRNGSTTIIMRITKSEKTTNHTYLCFRSFRESHSFAVDDRDCYVAVGSLDSVARGSFLSGESHEKEEGPFRQVVDWYFFLSQERPDCRTRRVEQKNESQIEELVVLSFVSLCP